MLGLSSPQSPADLALQARRSPGKADAITDLLASAESRMPALSHCISCICVAMTIILERNNLKEEGPTVLEDTAHHGKQDGAEFMVEGGQVW